MNSYIKIVATQCSLQAWFVSGIYRVSVDTLHKGDTEDDNDDDDDDDDDNNNNDSSNKIYEICGSYVDVNENAIHPDTI
jgi:hypothetical protein